MSNLKFILWICFFLFSFSSIKAQREQDTIKPEKLIITKQYNPSVNDAFKIKKQPKLGDSILPKPKALDYSILDVPVASTFSPAKGRAGGLRLQPDNFDNYNAYARVGAGNFTSILAEFFSELDFNERQRLQIGLTHFSSQGGISSVDLDDDFMRNALQLKFSSEEKQLVWDVYGGLSYNAYNYYGIDNEFMELFSQVGNDLSQHYLSFNLGGSLAFYDSAFKKIDLDFTTFTDNFNTQENRFQVKPQVDFYIGDQRIENFISFDYLAGELDNELASNFNYIWAITSYNPNIQINEDRFSIKLGAEFTYLSDIENSDGNFYVYPKVEGSYRINQDNLIAFGGVDGGLQQNSFQQFTQINPFVSPSSPIAPTNNQYDAFLGFKGGSYAWSYSARLSYRSQENNPFFRMNTNVLDASTGLGFDFNNSFRILYNDMNTAAIDVEIDYTINEKVDVGLHANYSSYDVGAMQSAWNLPNTSASIFANYKMNNQWTFGASLYYLGERDDLFFDSSSNAQNPEVVTLSSFVDANLSVQYKINNQLHAFVEAKNIFGGNYERWLNYPVQDFQVLGGVSFQFDW